MSLSLDPWMASSLLQKAIRRGETEFAQYAASVLHRYRGAAIWNRLMTIAVEDIGIADLDLVLEVTRFATDNALRSVVASDNELITDLTARLAETPKDRSADYLHSAAVWSVSTPQLVETGEEKSLVCEAVRLLQQCTASRGARRVISEEAARQLLRNGTYSPNMILEELLERLAQSGAHPFSLMLVPLQSALSKVATEPDVANEEVPKSQHIAGVPSYVFDKHTGVGKSAIARFARENPDMQRALSLWVAPAQQAQVAEMAAFYADAVPVSRKFHHSATFWNNSDAELTWSWRAAHPVAFTQYWPRRSATSKT